MKKSAKKSTKRKVTKKTTKKKTSKVKSKKAKTSGRGKEKGKEKVREVVYIREQNRPFKRVAGEQAIGGAAAGFGIAAGHSFGDWLFD